MSLYFLPHWRCNLTSLTDLKGTCSSSLSSPHISCDTHLRHEPIIHDVRKATGDKKLSFSKRGRHSLHKLSTLKVSPYIGLGSKVWLVVGLQGWRRLQKLTPCLTEPLPDGSKMDLEPAKPEPITKAGGTSPPTYLRRGKNCSSCERGVRVNERNTPADPPQQWRRGRRLSRGQNRDCSADCGEHHGGAGCSPQRQAQQSRDPRAASQSPRSWQELQPAKRSPGRSRFSHRSNGCGGPTLKQAVPEGLNLVEKTHAEAFHEGLSAMGGPHSGAREYVNGVWEGRNGKEELLWTDQSLHSLTLCATRGEEIPVGNEGVKLSLGREAGVKSAFSFTFVFHYSTLFLTIHYFCQMKPVLHVTVTDMQSPSLHLDPWVFPSYFLPVSCWGERVREFLGGHLAASWGQPTILLSCTGFRHWLSDFL